jgi:dihydroneopterin aldolase
MKIKINYRILFGHHGVYEEEKKNGQNFEISLSCKLSGHSSEDSIDQTVDYSAVMNTARDVFNKKNYNLIESLADDISSRVLLDFEMLTKVTVSIKKPNAPIDYNLNRLKVVVNGSVRFFY